MSPVLHLKETLQNIVGKDYASYQYLIAVSGGRDSMALLSAMAEVVPKSQLIAAHFDHRSRGKASQRDAAFVSRYCHQKGIECWIGERQETLSQADANQHQRAEEEAAKVGIVKLSEATLRKERWQFLTKLRRSTGADFIVTAHHLQDQLETFLMRFLRGSGLEGLAAMAEREKRVIRPWLHYPAEDIHQWAKKKRVPFCEDETNTLPIYFRNRIRHQLVPEVLSLASEFGETPAFYKRFAGLSSELQTHRKKLRRLAKRSFQKRASVTPFWIRLETNKPISAILLREIYQQLKVEVPSREKLREILIELNRLTKKATLPGDILVEASCGSLFFQSREQRQTQSQALYLHFNNGILEAPALGIRLRFPGEMAGMKARFFEPGDRLGAKKLKEYFVAQRIPSPERRFLPLLCSVGSKNVAWCYPQALPQLRVHRQSFPFSFLESSKKQ